VEPLNGTFVIRGEALGDLGGEDEAPA